MAKNKLPETITCEKCRNNFPRPTTRGRPPKRCESCRNPEIVEVKEVLEGKERMDALDIMLRSRGLHLSQQKEQW